MHVFYRSPKLDVAALGLDGRDLQLAQILAEETEAQREKELRDLPPLDPQEASSESRPVMGLLRLTQTVEERRRANIEAKSWDELLRLSDTHMRCAARAQVGLDVIVDFALHKCSPHNWEALFWYGAWVKEAVKLNMPIQALAAITEQAKREGAEAAVKNLGAKGGAGKDAKYEPARLWIVECWQREGDRWDSKKKFAEAHQELVQSKFGLRVSVSTITDQWLAPSRLTGK